MTDDLLTEYGAARGTSQDDPSGAAAARAAHDAGAVTPPREKPVHGVTIEFRVNADGPTARGFADSVAGWLLEFPIVVQPLTWAVTER